MWKDFFYYSKSERRSILVLMGIGILLLVFGVLTHSADSLSVVVTDSISIDSFCIREYKKQAVRDSWRMYKPKDVRITPVLTKFDPNIADSMTLCRLGLPSFVAKRIVKYREKGGLFHKPEDLSRIYGLTEQQYRRLEPYIVINKQQLENVLAHRVKVFQPGPKSHDNNIYHLADSDLIVAKNRTSEKYPEGIVVDLNTADTIQLKRVPGIGSGLAKMIVAYRNRLGGYATVSQLQEIPHMDSTVNRWFKIETQVFRLLRINHAGLDQLRNHPYMNFYKAKVILEYRRKRGKIKGLPQLSMFQEFTEKDLVRLEPYLDFE